MHGRIITAIECQACFRPTTHSRVSIHQGRCEWCGASVEIHHLDAERMQEQEAPDSCLAALRAEIDAQPHWPHSGESYRLFLRTLRGLVGSPAADAPTTGTRIHEMRILRGISIRALSGKAGIPYERMRTLDKGTRTPTVEDIAAIAAVLGCTPYQLTGPGELT